MKSIIFLCVITLIATLSVSGCRKKKDTLAHIYVKNGTNQSVDNAMVVLYGTNTAGTPQEVAVFDTSFTNVEGLATFNLNYIYQLGQAGVAVLDIKAQKLNQVGVGIIKIESEKVNEESVVINF